MALIPSPLLREIVAADYELLDFLLRCQARARGRFVRLGTEIPIIRAWQAIPGVGPVVAARFCAYVKCPHRFAKKGKLSRYSRLGVTQSETGGKAIRRQHLDPSGCGALKDISNKAFRAALNCRGDNLIKRSYLPARWRARARRNTPASPPRERYWPSCGPCGGKARPTTITMM
ncbi:MAG: transposase [Actinobacteria bacterium]|nr:transposase [Actinomycetota bacterium]